MQMRGYREGRGALSTGQVICCGLGDFTYQKIEKKMLVFPSNFGLKWVHNVSRKKRQFTVSQPHTLNLSPWAQREPPGPRGAKGLQAAPGTLPFRRGRQPPLCRMPAPPLGGHILTRRRCIGSRFAEMT